MRGCPRCTSMSGVAMPAYKRSANAIRYNVTSALASTDRQRNGVSKGAPDVPGDAALVQGDQATSPETTLTAFCQLTAIRLGVQRVGISLISSHQQVDLSPGRSRRGTSHGLIAVRSISWPSRRERLTLLIQASVTLRKTAYGSA